LFSSREALSTLSHRPGDVAHTTALPPGFDTAPTDAAVLGQMGTRLFKSKPIAGITVAMRAATQSSASSLLVLFNNSTRLEMTEAEFESCRCCYDQPEAVSDAKLRAAYQKTSSSKSIHARLAGTASRFWAQCGAEYRRELKELEGSLADCARSLAAQMLDDQYNVETEDLRALAISDCEAQDKVTQRDEACIAQARKYLGDTSLGNDSSADGGKVESVTGLLERMDKARSDRDTITAELARHVLRHEQSGARAAGKRPAEGAPGPAAPAPKQARAPPASFDWQVWSCETVPLIYAPDMPWNMPRMRENYALLCPHIRPHLCS